MADKIEVHFTTNKNEKVRAEVVSNEVLAVLNLPEKDMGDGRPTREKFMQDNGLTPASIGSIVPRLVKIKRPNAGGGDDTLSIAEAEPGPGVCYWVKGQLVCW